MSNNLDYKCPHCGQQLKIDEEWRGTQIACPYCNQTFIIQNQKSIGIRMASYLIDLMKFIVPSASFPRNIWSLRIVLISLIIFILVWLTAFSICDASGPVIWLPQPLLSAVFMKKAKHFEERYEARRKSIIEKENEEERSVGFSRYHTKETFDNDTNLVKAAEAKAQALYAQIAGVLLYTSCLIGLFLQISGIWQRNYKDSKLYFPTNIALLFLFFASLFLLFLGKMQGRDIECTRQYGTEWRTKMPKLQKEMLEQEKEHDKAFEKIQKIKTRRKY